MNGYIKAPIQKENRSSVEDWLRSVKATDTYFRNNFAENIFVQL